MQFFTEAKGAMTEQYVLQQPGHRHIAMCGNTEVEYGMGWKCIIAGGELEDIRQDRKASVRIEQYAVSERAVYFQRSYLPLKNVKAVRMQPSVYRPNHCCGIGIPVTKVRIDYGGEKPLVLMLEKEENAEKLCAEICADNPVSGLSWEKQ